MEAVVDKASENSKTAITWYRCAVASAIVAGIFTLIILTLIVRNYVRGRTVDPQWEKELETLKIEFQARPDDEKLLGRIRELDLQFRQENLRRPAFSRQGSYLLLGSLAVLLISLKYAVAFKRKLPAPQFHADRRQEQVREATWARWAAIAGFVILIAGALYLAGRPRIELPKPEMAVASYPSTEEIKKNWPYFRGPGGAGVSAYTNISDNWNGKTDQGILWKTKVRLEGFNSPIVWGDRVFLSGADPNEREVYCFDALSGELLWTGGVKHTPQKGDEPLEAEMLRDTSFAAPTLATDGRRVYAIFVTGDVACFDFNGREVWSRNLGIPESAYGYASSLTMYRNLLLIQYDQAGAEDNKSKMIALQAFSGQTAWETKRSLPNSWTSPIVAQIGDQHQVITVGDPWVVAYNPANGTELWRAKCMGGEVAPSPIYAGGYVFAIEPYAKLVAIRPDGKGDVTKTHIEWIGEDYIPDICSPVSNGELILLLTTEGMLTCYNVTDQKDANAPESTEEDKSKLSAPATRTIVWEKDLETYFRASPSIVGDRLYLMSEKGVMFIVKIGTEYQELARCELGEKSYASPAFADGRMYIRGLENLYCIGTDSTKSP